MLKILSITGLSAVVPMPSRASRDCGSLGRQYWPNAGRGRGAWFWLKRFGFAGMPSRIFFAQSLLVFWGLAQFVGISFSCPPLFMPIVAIAGGFHPAAAIRMCTLILI